MPKLTETTKREFTKRILDILVSNKDSLKTRGVDAEIVSSELSKLVDNAFSKENRQFQLQVQVKEATADSQKATEEAYFKASAAVELIVGALGKQDALSKRIRNIRDEIANEELRGKRART